MLNLSTRDLNTNFTPFSCTQILIGYIVDYITKNNNNTYTKVCKRFPVLEQLYNFYTLNANSEIAYYIRCELS